MERHRTEAVLSVKEGSVCGQTLEKPGRARFVVPVVKGLPKAQAATAGPEKNRSIQYHLLPRAQRPRVGLSWYLTSVDCSGCTYQGTFCRARYNRKTLDHTQQMH